MLGTAANTNESLNDESIGDGGRPPHTLSLDYLQKEKQNHATQPHNAAITLVSQGEYPDIYYYNYYKANHARQRTDAQQK